MRRTQPRSSRRSCKCFERSTKELPSSRASLSPLRFQLVDHFPNPGQLVGRKAMALRKSQDERQGVAVTQLAREIVHPRAHNVFTRDKGPEHECVPALVTADISLFFETLKQSDDR